MKGAKRTSNAVGYCCAVFSTLFKAT